MKTNSEKNVLVNDHKHKNKRDIYEGVRSVFVDCGQHHRHDSETESIWFCITFIALVVLLLLLWLYSFLRLRGRAWTLQRC